MDDFFGTQDTFGNGDFMFTFGPIFILLVFVIIISVIVFAIIQAIYKWNKNNQQPRLTSSATVVTKRTATNGGGDSSSYSSYYVTFELPSGERKEFLVKGSEYGQLVEGDKGEIEYQGTRYLGFIRNTIVYEK